MAFFGLIPTSNTPKATSKRPLVAIDWAYARRRNVDFAFLKELNNPLVWVFFQRPNQDAVWQELVNAYTVTPYQAPRTERNLSTFLTATLAHGLAENAYPSVVIVGSRGLFQGLAEWITDTLEVPATVQGGGRGGEKNERGERNEKHERGEKSGRKRGERKTRGGSENGSVNTRGGRENAGGEKKQRTWPEEDLRNYAEQIEAFFKQKYTVGESYKKSFFGMAIKQATGQNSYTVFRTKNAGPFIQHLQDIGCLELTDTQVCLVLRLPTAEEILALSLRTTKRGPRRDTPTHEAHTSQNQPHAHADDDVDTTAFDTDTEDDGMPPSSHAPSAPVVNETVPAEETEVVWDELAETSDTPTQ